MARRRRLATILAYLTLEVGALVGVPVRLDQIEEMTRLLNRTQVTWSVERGGRRTVPMQRPSPAALGLPNLTMRTVISPPSALTPASRSPS